MQTKTDCGPLFVVGLSRSGTKLLRDLLNQHPGIRIPTRESYFIPEALRRFARHGNAPDAASRKAFIKYFHQTAFSRNMADHGQRISQIELQKLVAGDTWPEIIESLFRYYTGTAGRAYIWGDKTPKYLNQMLFLKQHFPAARFLHIYRDPRDRVLSAQKAWGANIYIGAQQWLEGMHGAQRQALELGADYHQVCYESLVSAPEPTMIEVCRFLALPFSPGMTTLNAPVERRGDLDHPTRRSGEIIAGNTGNFRREMSQKQLLRVEKIVFPFAATLGYKPEALSGTGHKPLGFVERVVYGLPHYFGSLRMLARRWGILRGFRYAVSRWRL
jgi:hypothetical protein